MSPEPRPAWKTRPHGSDARARKHYRDGEKPCDACLIAQREARRRRVDASGMSNSEARLEWWRRKKAGQL